MTMVVWPVTEAPMFLASSFIGKADENTICVGVMNQRGDAYAFTRIPKTDFLRAVGVIIGADLS